jgi:ATP-dependent DNA helicase RecQ
LKDITYIDIEVDPKSGMILDMAAVQENGSTWHGSEVREFASFIANLTFICGHNVLKHDIPFLQKALGTDAFAEKKIIDTLYLSALLFPAKPYHKLVKDDKLISEAASNPLNDTIQAKDLFHDCLNQFRQLEGDVQVLLQSLLDTTGAFSGFFDYLDHPPERVANVESLIRKTCGGLLCAHAPLDKMISKKPIALAYALMLIRLGDLYSLTPPWVLHSFPETDRIVTLLRGRPCNEGCNYCDEAFNPHEGLKFFFGFEQFRTYAGEPLQEKAVRSALAGRSLLSIFPTGGGKSLTFQLPALIAGTNSRGLTVVISPLQSLMKDQVDNLESKKIHDAVTINGLLDPIERANALERVKDGSANLLYIAPESLRSRTIERLLLGRRIERFVIDEAHCFSAWGQDFRVDYLYIGDFIKNLEAKKLIKAPIPVSCFTATAKPQVIEDIQNYFSEKLNLHLELIQSQAGRQNLHYHVLEREDEEGKYQALRQLVEGKDSPCIVYVSRTMCAYTLAERLSKDGLQALPYHGKMDKEEKSKNQDAFMNDEVQIIVATSAFGMGVDKKDVGLVVHYDISDSLENYLQEAGRAGRDERMQADCYVLYSEEDLNKHFLLLNQTKVTQKEINQVWRAVKSLTKFRKQVSQSALEIARRAGWDEGIQQIETRVTTAISALETAGYLRRGQNSPRVFATSILVKTAQKAIDKINVSSHFTEKEKVNAARIIKKLIAGKNRKNPDNEVAESRVDYISDHLGIVRHDVIRIINLLREEKILDDTKDLSAFIMPGEGRTKSLSTLQTCVKLERHLQEQCTDETNQVDLKYLNESALDAGIEHSNLKLINALFNFWSVKNWVKVTRRFGNGHKLAFALNASADELKERAEKRASLASFILTFLFRKLEEAKSSADQTGRVLFSVFELREAYKTENLFVNEIKIEEVEEALFFLSRIGAMKIEGGFMVVYNALTLERLEDNTAKQYTLKDYEDLDRHYKTKVEQIHIVGEYAKRMVSDYTEALAFVDDYFQLNYNTFLRKYFPGERRTEIRQNISPAKFRQLFVDSLSPAQLAIIKDQESQYIAVTAGPGSGKTRVLVHKLASLVLMEDIKQEQLLMLTFSRAAATEFKLRLMELIGNVAHFLEIKTFHSYCFDLLGKVGSLEKSDEIVTRASEAIKSGDIDELSITKTVLVIDEAQDMSEAEYGLIQALIVANPDMRIIAVGDDDQNIYAFRGSSSEYFQRLITEKGAKQIELVENYRSDRSIVFFSNQFAEKITKRLKKTPAYSHGDQAGLVRLVNHAHREFTTGIVDDLAGKFDSGSSAVLCHTNRQALIVDGLLRNREIPSRLIRANDGFSLMNLHEFRTFTEMLNPEGKIIQISNDGWAAAKRQLKEEFSRSKLLPAVLSALGRFEKLYNKYRYFSDWETFVSESNLEDFVSSSSETVIVSTLHKAKGKEWDNVYLALDRSASHMTEEDRRLLYVGMTRARRRLYIHTCDNPFSDISNADVDQIECAEVHPPPAILKFPLTHKDVQLGYFKYVQSRVKNLQSGDELKIFEDGLADVNDKKVLRFSKGFREKLADLEAQHYHLEKGEVSALVFWKPSKPEDEQKTKEVLIVLGEVKLVLNDKPE